jgi:hypothetical protein
VGYFCTGSLGCTEIGIGFAIDATDDALVYVVERGGLGSDERTKGDEKNKWVHV